MKRGDIICKICEKDSFNVIMLKEIIDDLPILLGSSKSMQTLYYTNLDLAVDIRENAGYIRLGDSEDMGCLDHGLKYEIKYCFECGRKLDE